MDNESTYYQELQLFKYDLCTVICFLNDTLKYNYQFQYNPSSSNCT